MAHLLTLNDLSLSEIDAILNRAEAFQKKEDGAAIQPRSTMVANLFFEPSTRTRFSFETAEKRLGFQVLNFSSQTSSTQKGETLYDTVRTLEAIGVKAAVIRHKEDGYYRDLMDRVGVSILNAGDGSGDHPTQALLDLLTIRQEFLLFQGLTIAIIGDLRHSRVARSDAGLFSRFGCRVILSGPPEWKNDGLQGEYAPVDEAVRAADVIIMLRIQHERHAHSMMMTKEEYHRRYGLTDERAGQMKPGSIIMHPGPINRGVELAADLVESSRSRYFKQIKNGVAVRMACLEWALETKRGTETYECVAQKL